MVKSKEQERLLSEAYLSLRKQMLNYSYIAMHDDSSAEEAVQDCFRIACEKIDEFSSSPDKNRWIFTVLRYVIKNKRRAIANLNKLVVASLSLDKTEFIEEHASGTDTTVRIDDGNIDILYSDLISDEDYTLLKMVSIHNCTMLETAKYAGCSVEACKKRIQRAKKKLKELLG